MKTINSSLIVPLLTILFPLTLNSCYTQCTFVYNEQYAPVDPAPRVIIIAPVDPLPMNHPIMPIIIPRPIEPPTLPVIRVPKAERSSPVIIQPASSPARNSEYQRSDRSDGMTKTTGSNPSRSPAGPVRSGR